MGRYELLRTLYNSQRIDNKQWKLYFFTTTYFLENTYTHQNLIFQIIAWQGRISYFTFCHGVVQVH